ncbi:MAG: glycoside hydrolase family 31 protein, partial [Candidatus Omnitrophica bacterium]|nr:glycoside hydrolase family 31 protein [Candidatus Omnitrophota bacterium]
LFGEDFLVAPIYQDSLRNTVHIPRGRWRYFFDDSEVFEGPKTIERDFPLDEYPVYVRDGAIIPMRISRDYTGIGDKDWEGLLTFNIFPSGRSTFEVHHPEGGDSTRVTVEEGATLRIQIEGAPVAHILRVLLAERPARVLRGETELAEGSDWEYRSERKRLILRSKGEFTGRYAIERN